MTVTTRHIRHDWTSWVDWPETVQKTVKTVCGVRSKPHLCGIPGVTKQERIVTKSNGSEVWGWCQQCVKTVWPWLNPPALNRSVAPQAIIDLHTAAQREIVGQYYRHRLAVFRYAQKQGLSNVQMLADQLQTLEVMFFDEVAEVK